MRILIFLFALFFSTTLFASENKNEIKKFLFTNPAQVNFENAGKFLPKPFSKALNIPWVGGEYSLYDALQSNFVEFNSGKVQLSILKNIKYGYYLYGMEIPKPQSCESFIEMVKDAYDKDFVFNVTDNLVLDGKKGKQVVGSIDIQSWRASLFCYEEESDSNGNFSVATITLGSKRNIKKIEARKKISCTMQDGNQIDYQIDDVQKLLLGINNGSWGTSRVFNDDFIIVEATEMIIKIDRKSGKLTITSRSDSNVSLYGSCEKRSSEKKF